MTDARVFSVSILSHVLSRQLAYFMSGRTYYELDVVAFLAYRRFRKAQDEAITKMTILLLEQQVLSAKGTQHAVTIWRVGKNKLLHISVRDAV